MRALRLTPQRRGDGVFEHRLPLGRREPVIAGRAPRRPPRPPNSVVGSAKPVNWPETTRALFTGADLEFERVLNREGMNDPSGDE